MNKPEQPLNVDGVRAVELHYRAIREISGGNTSFYQSQTWLNSPGLGVMLPDAYREVAEMSVQCINLFALEFVQALEACNTFTERELNYGWLSVYMPIWFLKETKAEKKALEYCAKYNVPTNRVCFELSEKLLAETDGSAADAIRNMRNRGFHFMLTDFGGSACPMMRLADFNVDYVMLSPEVANYIGRDERSDSAVKSIIGFVSDMGCETVADGVVNARQAERLYEFECLYCAGPLAGKYITERYVRRRSDE
jgi:EAL domain-containing protein (putative c-di-GMP-specific phosphodiesterase class I)